MEFMRAWILSVTVSAMIIAVAEGLMPEGMVKKVGKLTGGLILILGILQPIVRMDYDELFLAANGLERVTVESQIQEQSGEFLKSIIEQETAAYVLDKAQTLGYFCTVEISCELDETGVPVPCRAVIRGLESEVQRQEMRRLIMEDLGIPKEQQTYINEEVT